MEAVCEKMKSTTRLYVIDSGDHSFKIAKKLLQSSGLTQDEAEDLAVQAVAEFVSNVINERWNLMSQKLYMQVMWRLHFLEPYLTNFFLFL